MFKKLSYNKKLGWKFHHRMKVENYKMLDILFNQINPYKYINYSLIHLLFIGGLKRGFLKFKNINSYEKPLKFNIINSNSIYKIIYFYYYFVL